MESGLWEMVCEVWESGCVGDWVVGSAKGDV